MAGSRPFGRFVLVGGLGFLIDAGLTLGLIWFGAAPFLARVPAILVAMAFTWQCNRRWTYGITRSAGWHEALRYLGVAGALALVNYILYSCLVMAGAPALPALVAASAAQTGMAFFGYRRFAFRQRRR